MNLPLWDNRIRRAAELSRLWPWAREILDFFQALAEFQRDLAARLPEPLPADPVALAQFFPGLFCVAERAGPPLLAEHSGNFRKRGEEFWKRSLRSFWNMERGEPPADFFARSILQPYAHRLAANRKSEIAGRQESESAGACPICRHPPAAGILREAGASEGLQRSLLCSLCFTEWSAPRILCPGCGEEEPEKLHRLSAAEIPWIRVEACAACRRYLKAVDLTGNPGAEPYVDELAAAPLDLIAREEGYRKFEPGLAGI